MLSKLVKPSKTLINIHFRCISSGGKNQQIIKDTSLINPRVAQFYSNIPTTGYVWESQYGKLSTENFHLPLHNFIWKDLNKWHDKQALICSKTERSYKYGKLRDHCAALAIKLQHRNFQLNVNDVINVCLPNIPEYPIATLGAIEAGLIVSTINPIYTVDEMWRQFTINQSKATICTVQNYSTVVKACDKSERKQHIIVIKTDANDTVPDEAIDFFELINLDGVDFKKLKVVDCNPSKDLAFLPFSSGTTGLPKGVMLTHLNIVSNCEMLRVKLKTDTLVHSTTDNHQDVLPSILPFFHIYGLTVNLLSKLSLGCKLVTMSSFHLDTYVDLLLNERATALFVVPSIVVAFGGVDKITLEHLKSIRVIVCGAAPLGGLDVERLYKKAPHIQLLQGYGCTEHSPMITLGHFEIEKTASIGFLTPGVSGKIISINDSKLNGLGPNQEGELLVRSVSAMKGYLNNREATNSTLVGENGEWLRTGDIAYYDTDGYFYIKDRLKEFIKVKGFQVSPAELEEIIRDHPNVLDVGVIGVPHIHKGEVPRAFVVKKPNTVVSEEEVKNHVCNRLSEYKRLEGGVKFIDAVPRNASGKILRRLLKENV